MAGDVYAIDAIDDSRLWSVGFSYSGQGPGKYTAEVRFSGQLGRQLGGLLCGPISSYRLGMHVIWWANSCTSGT